MRRVCRHQRQSVHPEAIPGGAVISEEKHLHDEISQAGLPMIAIFRLLETSTITRPYNNRAPIP